MTKPKQTRTAPDIATGEAPKGFTPPAKPAARGGGSKPLYPFDELANVGDFFGVKNKSVRQMTGPIRSAQKRHTDEVKDAAGEVVSTTVNREFYAVEVDDATAKKLKGTDFEGSSVLVVRSK